MPRPKGHTLSRPAFDDLLRLTGKSLTQVAALADVPRASLSALYIGHNGASIPTAHKIAAALDVHPATLFPTLRANGHHPVA